MQLNEILEENSIESISQRTNISETNLNTLAAGDFDKLKRVKTLGFISIIEREFKADLSHLREQALEYYENNSVKESVTIGLPLPEEKKGISAWFKLLMLILIAFTIWYFFTQFDKTMLTDMLPPSEEKIGKMVSEDVKKELSIENRNKEDTEAVVVPVLDNSTVRDNETDIQQY
jgi:cytoskeletal protein RodZ